MCLLTAVCPVMANPVGGEIAAGSATIRYGSTTVVTQQSNRAIVNWKDFSIDANETTRFNLPNSKSVILNRVTGNNVSKIMGNLTSNGQVFLVNRNGIVFGKTARVDVAGLVASTADIRNEDFMQGNYHFTNAPEHSQIINEGSITVRGAGLAALVAPSVQNSGTIQAHLGRVALAAGNAFTVDLYGDNLISFDATSMVSEGNVSNFGRIEANGGIVVLSAAAADALVENQVNMSGYISATTVDQKEGKIVLRGYGNTDVNVSGTLDVSAAQTGNAGEIMIFSDGNTTVSGNLYARGGSLLGNGGFIETSGHNLDISNIFVNASSMHGKAGLWLLDPVDILINDAAAPTYITMLGNGTDVLLVADNNITFTNSTVPITWSTGASFSAYAGTSVIISTGAGVALNSTGTGNISLHSDVNNDNSGTVSFISGAANAVNAPSATVTLYYNPTVNPFLVNAGTFIAYHLVHNATELQDINLDLSGSYALAGDISSGLGAFTPIGDSGTPFTGNFSGNGYTISNLTINLPGTDNVGLFGYTFAASIDNVQLSNVNITGQNYVGAAIGFVNATTLSGAFSSSGTVTGTGFMTGGLFGQIGNISTIASGMSATVSGTVNGTAVGTGGILGAAQPGNNFNSTLAWTNYATVTGTLRTGGVIGETFDSLGNMVLINHGAVSGTQMTGGVLGYVDFGQTIGGLIGSDGNVTGSIANVGGVVGWLNGGFIAQSYFTGTLTASGTGIGGIAGTLSGTLTNGFFGGTIVLNGASDAVGGIAGENQGTIGFSLSIGTITGSGADTNVGAVIGSSVGGSVFDNTFYSTQQLAGLNAIGSGANGGTDPTGLINILLSLESTFSGYGWDFTSTWTAPGGNRFVTLQGCNGACTVSFTAAPGSIPDLGKQYVTVDQILNNNILTTTPTLIYYSDGSLLYTVPLTTGDGIYVWTVTPDPDTTTTIEGAFEALKSAYGCSTST